MVHTAIKQHEHYKFLINYHTHVETEHIAVKYTSLLITPLQPLAIRGS